MAITLGLAARMGVVLAIISSFYIALYLGLTRIAPVPDIWIAGFIGGILAIQVLTSSFLFLRSVNSEKVNKEEVPWLFDIVEEVCENSGVRTPTIRVIDTQVPNAFATGITQRTATVCVTTGLIHLLDPDEMQAVIAHEIAHIKNRDMIIMTIASFPAIIAFKFYAMAHSIHPNHRGLEAQVLLVVSYTLWVFSMITSSSLSRYREYIADYDATKYIDNPEDMTAALEKVTYGVQKTSWYTDGSHGEDELNMLFVVPLSGSATKYFSTHPDTDSRVDRIKELYS